MGQTPRELMNEKRGSNVVKNLEARIDIRIVLRHR